MNALIALLLIFISIFFVLLIGYLFLIRSYSSGWNELPPSDAGLSDELPSVSVIIPFRNEAENLPSLLSCLRALDYPKHLLEIVLIDDESTDASPALVVAAIKEFYSARLLTLADFISPGTRQIAYKKKAIETAIANSTGSWIVTTDADCHFQPGWVHALMTYASREQLCCIAAPVKIEPGKSVLGIFQSLDFLALQGITGAAVHRRLHMMCNGANFAYTRAAFIEVNGFEGIDAIPSGDDMLLMQKIYDRHPGKVGYLKDADAIVTTARAANWRLFFQQRIRWASKTGHYSDKKIVAILALVWFFNLSFLIMAVVVIVNPKWGWLFLLFLLAKWLIEYDFVSTVSRFFKLNGLMKFFLLLQPLHILYTVTAGFLGKFGSYEWKGRKIKTGAI